MVNGNVSQINGIKFYIVDEQHVVDRWKEHEWFWAGDDGTTHNVGEVLKKYSPKADNQKISTDERNGEEIFLVNGKLDPNDCGYYDPDKDGKPICIPNVSVEKIEVVNE